jgi:hypothetical protein
MNLSRNIQYYFFCVGIYISYGIILKNTVRRQLVKPFFKRKRFSSILTIEN